MTKKPILSSQNEIISEINKKSENLPEIFEEVKKPNQDISDPENIIMEEEKSPQKIHNGLLHEPLPKSLPFPNILQAPPPEIQVQHIQINPLNPDDINIDEMTYEQLLELEEIIGKVSKGLTNEQINVFFGFLTVIIENCMS